MAVTTFVTMNRFSIKDIENITGIKAHTIRIWEQRYGILQPKRTQTNIRYYDANDLKTALRISLLNGYGYKISRIHEMSDADMNALIRKISDEEFQLQIFTNELLAAALAMDTILFDKLLTQYIVKKGIEATIEGPIFQFLEKAGILWMTDHLIPAQEHLASNVLYRKLAVAIESLPMPSESASKVLLFLPEGEVHEMALMYVHYLLRKKGKMSIHLGQNTPFLEVISACQALKPDYLYTHLTAVTEGWDGNKYLQKLSEGLGHIPILVSGPLLHRRKIPKTANITLLYSLREVREIMARI